MKSSILALAPLLAATTTTASPLLPRSAMCWANSIESTTTPLSPLVSDCLALATSGTIPAFTPSPENNYSFDLRHGTCGLRGVFTVGGSLAAEENVIDPVLVEVAIEHAVEQWGGGQAGEGTEGRVQAKGTFACMVPGMLVKMGWTSWEMYTVEVPEVKEPEVPVVPVVDVPEVDAEVPVKCKRHHA